MPENVLDLAFVAGLLTLVFRLATPLLLASVANLVPALAGVVDMSPEGTMTLGAFFGFLVVQRTGSLWLGVVAGGLAGLVCSLLSALMIVVLKIRHSVAGIGQNLLAAGLTFYFFRTIYGSAGGEIPHVPVFDRVYIPGLSDLPIVGVLFNQHALTYLAYAVVALLWLVIYKTKYGLILRTTGEEPRAVDTKGISVGLVQLIALVVAGVLYGIAGAFLPLVSTGIFVTGIVAGRGWIAVTLVVFGRFKPVPIAIGALFFGFLTALQLQIQALGVRFPYEILLALPFLATVVALVVRGRESQDAPAHLGLTYQRE